jgi:hypothetical protein
VGYYTEANSPSGFGFLATPVPEPAAAGLAGFAVLLLVMMRRRPA